MDSTIAAALVSVPASLFAAVTAYGAGRVQGRGAVDSVRRASQRESYGQLLAAGYEFVDAGRRILPHFDASFPPSLLAPLPGTPEQALDELNGLVRRIGERAAVVKLDGPPHIAELAHAVWDAAAQVSLDAHLSRRPAAANQPGVARSPLLFDKAMTTFAEEASEHLNTGLLPWWRRRRARRTHVPPVLPPGP
ncbi:hypothetical protein ACF09H_29810 [Streptomyces sp. NPDC014983]|uniref:hypothetical protein n=1 Tax=Streptomyces sp. NPDC014983 TaxID=3364933 RepID=UPI0036F97E5A